MILTTLEHVRAYAKRKPSETDDDARFEHLIGVVSARVEAYLDREVQTKARTVYLNVDRDGQTRFPLRAWPVVASSTGVRYDSERKWGTETALDAADFVDPHFDPMGVLVVETFLAKGSSVLRVSYTGGMGLDTDAFVAAYPDIADIVAMATFYLWKNGGRVGERGVSGGRNSGGKTLNDPTDVLLPELKMRLDPYRRFIGV